MVGVPLVMWQVLPPYALLPVIWGMAVICHHIASASNGWRPEAIWRVSAINPRELRAMLMRFALCALALAALTYAIAPEALFGFVREKPKFWALVMVLYPLLSVVPQEIIFRRYVFARFKPLFSPRGLVLVSGLGFGFAHVVFDNWLAPLLCVIGGLMFANTYARSRSLALVSLEHALYGDFIFTIGLGRYFFHGAVGMNH